MHIDRPKLAQLFSDILANVRPRDEINHLVSQEIARSGWLLRSHALNSQWGLNESAHSKFQEVLNLLLQSSWIEDAYRVAELDAVLQDEILRAHEKHVPGQAATEKLLDTLRASPKQFTVVYPLANLTLELDALQLGRTTLYPANAPELDEWRMAFELATETEPSPAETWADTAAYAAVRVRAAEGSQMVVAERYLQEALDYLHSYVAVALRDDMLRFGIKGQVNQGVVSVYAFDQDGSYRHSSVQWLGSVAVVLPTEDEQDMKRNWGLDAIRDLFSKPRSDRGRSGDDMMYRLTLALYWAARARQHSLPILSVVDYCTAMETLVLKKSGKSEFGRRLSYLMQKWCEKRAVSLQQLVVRNQKASGVESLEHWAKDMYKQRSRCLHAGRLDMDPTLERQANFWWAFVALAAITTVAENLNDWPTFDKFEHAYKNAH